MNQKEQTLSTNKIIVSLVFLCAAIMASVFVFYATHKAPTKQELSSDIGLIFPVARDVKELNLVQSNGEPLTLNNFREHWSLVFFGFTHCANVCPTTLNLLQHVYEPLKSKYPNLQVVFISLDPERDTKKSLADYINTYNAEFIGASGKIEELRKLQSQLGIYAKKMENGQGQGYQIQHTSSILLINPQGKWAGLFKFGLTPAQLIEGVNRGIS